MAAPRYPFHYDPLELTLAPPGLSSTVHDPPQQVPVALQFSHLWSNLDHISSQFPFLSSMETENPNNKNYDLLEKFQDVSSYSHTLEPYSQDMSVLGTSLVGGGNGPNWRELNGTGESSNKYFSTQTSSRGLKKRKPPRKRRTEGKNEVVPKPYKWAQSHRAKIYNLDYLLSNGINKISGEVQCKRCDKKYDIIFDLTEKFDEVASFFREEKYNMHHRAPSRWMNPILPDCEKCKQKNCVKPVDSKKKREINWLFLLLGEMLGCCKLAELRYFCKHTENHRTGAKDRVLYLTYLGLCKQLDPKGPFDLEN